MIAALAVAAFAALAVVPAGAQCCGDCDGDGRVRIDELVTAVGAALGTCPDEGPLVALSDAELTYLQAPLHHDVVAGTISFTVAIQWAGADESDRPLILIRRPSTWPDRVELIKNGRFLRWILTDHSGREYDLSASIDGWQAGQMHAVSATWGAGHGALTVDGALLGEQALDDEVRLLAGDMLQVGDPDQSGTLFRQLTLLGR